MLGGRLNARTRFIVLFLLFDTMFCLVLLLVLQNTELTEDKVRVEEEYDRARFSLERVEATASGAVEHRVAACRSSASATRPSRTSMRS